MSKAKLWITNRFTFWDSKQRKYKALFLKKIMGTLIHKETTKLFLKII